MLTRMGRYAASHPWRYLAVWILVAAMLAGTVLTVGDAFTESISAPASESSEGLAILTAEFPSAGGDQGTIVFRAEQGVDDPAVEAAMSALFESAKDVDGIVNVISPYSPMGGTQIASDGDAAGTIAYAQLIVESGTTTAEGEEIAAQITAEIPDIDGLEVALGGDMFRERKPPNSEMLGLAFAIFVLIVVLGSVLAVGLPIVTAFAGVGLGALATVLISNLIEMPDFAGTIGIMIGLGVGIDYALFIVTRHLEYLNRGYTVPDAVGASLNSAGRSVLFAGVTVVVSLLGMILMGITFVTGLAVAASTTVFITMIASVTLLPALMGLVGGHVLVTRWRGLLASLFVAVGMVGVALEIPVLRVGFALAVIILLLGWFWAPLKKTVSISSDKPIEETSSYKWSRFVQRRAWIVMIAGIVPLAILAVPVMSLDLGFADASNDPEGTTTRIASDLLTEGFGPGANGPLLVITELPEGASTQALQQVGNPFEGVDGIAHVYGPIPNDPQQPTAVLWRVIPDTSPQDEATADLVHRLRDTVIPQIDAKLGTDMKATGAVAANIDFSDYLAERIGYFYGAVLLLSFLFLMVVFRSILVPVIAVVVNLLAISAAYGVVIAVFQWSWGGGLLGIRAGPIEPFIPMMLFAIVFGLSMDYEVFLLARIREEYDRTGDNGEAVADGLAATARVITAAALIMVFVFGSFLLEDLRTIKILGLGLAVAVAIVAGVVRMLLVPAAMQLNGHANWWIPKWLDRILPNLVVEPEIPDPVPAEAA